MILLRYLPRIVDVNLGMIRNWCRTFKHEKITVSEGGHPNVLSVDGVRVSFSFARISNTRIKSGTYIVALYGDRVYYILPILKILRPAQELGKNLKTSEYLQLHSVASFSVDELKQWESESKISIC